VVKNGVYKVKRNSLFGEEILFIKKINKYKILRTGHLG